MNKLLQTITLVCAILCLPLSPLEAQSKDDKKSASKAKTYADIVTDKAQSQEGLFSVHKVADKYYFELPNELLEKEILVVSRISGFVKNLNFGGAGTKSRPQQVIRWQRKDDNILLRSVSYNSVASHEEPIYESVRNNNFEPIVMVFPIAAPNADSSGVLIEVNNLFTSDVPMIGAMTDRQRKNFKIKKLDSKRSLINSIKSFPKNVEVKHYLTYTGDALPDNQLTGSLSVEMNQSFIVLPEDPWPTRYYDDRVGYFSISQTDYSSDAQKALKKRYITRWRLDPVDMEAYKRGELVEPKKPIVYYIDPATPAQWIPYLKQGVEDWQKSFEKAGFKNAIIAKDPPSKEEDPDWSPEDVRYSVIRYITTDIQNAMGPHVHDPRTGEILESDIMWYHNVMNLLRNWFFVQTAAINPEARTPQLKKEVMGELIRFVAAHEVGHTLGLPHNMGSSPAYPVDSLRSPTFTHRMGGTAPSIMDYARFNYIAQPEDGDVLLYPGIGPYDNWSIEYGYRLVPDAKGIDAEEATLNKWVKERAGDPLYRYGRQTRNPSDPSAQTEDLGDDAVKASDLGIKNLKRIVPNLTKWTSEEGKNYAELEELYGQILSQLGRYMRHVGTNVGGVYDYKKTADEEGAVFTPVSKGKQKAAINFLDRQLFQTPTWLLDKDILSKIESSGTLERIRSIQVSTLNRLFQADRLNRLIEHQALNGNAAYGIGDLMSDTKNSIFATGKDDAFRRNLQRAYVDQLLKLTKLEDAKYQTDIQAAARGVLNDLNKSLKKRAKVQKQQLTRYHFEELKGRIEKGLTD